MLTKNIIDNLLYIGGGVVTGLCIGFLAIRYPDDLALLVCVLFMSMISFFSGWWRGFDRGHDAAMNKATDMVTEAKKLLAASDAIVADFRVELDEMKAEYAKG